MSNAHIVERVQAAHARERLLIAGVTDRQARAASALPGWTRGHVLAARLAFVRAACRQITYAAANESVEFYDGGRQGRDALIEANADLPADDLVLEVLQATKSLDHAWSTVDGADWARPVSYRGPGVLSDLLRASWREVELHCVDLDIGLRPRDWSAEFCAQLFEFLAPRVPDGVQLELVTPAGEIIRLGEGEPVQVSGTLTDLAAWLAGRTPDDPPRSSTGVLPQLRRLRDARR